MTHSNSPAAAMGPRKTSLVRVGGALGIASNLIGLAAFFAVCAGLNAAMALSIIPLVLAVPGLILTIVGGVMQKDPNVEDTHVLASIFINIAGIIGGLVMFAVWRGWEIFPGGVPTTPQ